MSTCTLSAVLAERMLAEPVLAGGRTALDASTNTARSKRPIDVARGIARG